MPAKGGNNIRPHLNEERERTTIALPRSLMNRARERGPGTMLSAIETAVSLCTLLGMPTFVREMIEQAAEKDGRPYAQFFLNALVEGVRVLSRNSVYAQVDAGTFPCVRIGGLLKRDGTSWCAAFRKHDGTWMKQDHTRDDQARVPEPRG
jgi:hypothetical protein